MKCWNPSSKDFVNSNRKFHPNPANQRQDRNGSGRNWNLLKELESEGFEFCHTFGWQETEWNSCVRSGKENWHVRGFYLWESRVRRVFESFFKHGGKTVDWILWVFKLKRLQSKRSLKPKIWSEWNWIPIPAKSCLFSVPLNGILYLIILLPVLVHPHACIFEQVLPKH